MAGQGSVDRKSPPLAWGLGLCALALIAMIPARVRAESAENVDQETGIVRAVFASGQLWLLSNSGKLSRISEGTEVRVNEDLPEPALDLCLQDGHPVVMTCREEGCGKWKVLRWEAGRWLGRGTVTKSREGLVAMDCGSERLTLVTTRRLINFDGDKERGVRLSQKIGGGIAAVHVTGSHVFVGLNVGEWGGGLRRIDRQSGQVRVIENNASGELCGGPLNTACDPVNGIAPEPWNPACVAAAVGLVHFAPHGRIVEVCGDGVQRLYFKPYGDQSVYRARKPGEEPFSTVAFFGLRQAGNDLLAVGIDGLYRIGADGTVRSVPLPEFKAIGGIGVSFDLPDVVLVLTQVNIRHSVSGNLPMLVPR